MAGSTADFDRILSRELIVADGVRAKLMAALLAVGTVTAFVLSFFVPSEAFRPGMGPQHLHLIFAFTAATAGVEFFVWRRIQQVIRGEHPPRPAAVWGVVAAECLVTTALVGAVSLVIDDPSPLSSPALLLYGVVIATSPLGLAPRLSLFAGAVCATSYLLLALLLVPSGRVGAPDTDMTVYLARAFNLLLTGGAAAFVAHQLRSRFHHTAEAMEQRNFVVGVFGRYLSNEVVDVLLHDPEGLRLGGTKSTVTLLMTDLRGFSNTSERMDPQQVVRMLNHYLGAMTEVIGRHGGTIDEFIGDAILVIWNAPLPQPDHAQRAVRCALEMQAEMDTVNAWNRAQGLPEIEMGIGVHTGDVVVGNIGSAQRQKYGVVGSTVNLTARVESYTVGGQVLITAATAASVGEGLIVRSEREVYPKGATAAVRLLDVVGLGDQRLPERVSTLREIAPLPVELRPLEGKDLAAEAVPGELVALSKEEASLRCALPLVVYQNLALVLGGGQAFAKVMAVGETALLRFTSLDAKATAARDAALSG